MIKKTRLPHWQEGFSFIEVMIAVAIFAIGALVMSSTSQLSSNSLAFDKDRAVATEIATSVLEDLLNRSSSDAAFTGPQPQTELFDSNQNVVTTGGMYTVTWTTTASTPIANIMQIQLSVTWNVVGNAKSLFFTTYRSSR